MTELEAETHRRVNPLFIATAALAVAFFSQQTFRLLRSNKRSSKYKSRSRHPQIARWESEGGMVPEVRAVQTKTTH